MSTIDSFLETAWAEHAERPREVAERLARSLELLKTPVDIAPFAQLVVHVYGEHLGQWDAGASVLRSMRDVPAVGADRAAVGALDAGIAALRYAGGERAALAALTIEDRIRALATAASALAGRGEIGGAIDAYAQALRLADDGLPARSPALRALAVGGNNLAATLEEMKGRSAAETEGMLVAAEAGVKYWQLAGTWLEHERAEYRLARSLLQAGVVPAAVEAAQRCLAICERNDAPAFERFFAHAVLALAQHAADNRDGFEAERSAALACHEQVPANDKAACDSDLKELQGTRS